MADSTYSFGLKNGGVTHTFCFRIVKSLLVGPSSCFEDAVDRRHLLPFLLCFRFWLNLVFGFGFSSVGVLSKNTPDIYHQIFTILLF